METHDNAIQALRDSKRLVRELKSNFPKDVIAREITLTSKLPFKAVSIKRLLYYRLTELCGVAVNLFQKGNFTSAIIITRSALETLAIVFYVYEKIDQVVDSGILGDIDETMMRILFGCKNRSLPMEAINVLTAIEHLDRRLGNDKIFRNYYDTLSETAHPNYFGMLGAYGDVDELTKTIKLRKGNQEAGMLATLPLITILEAFILFHGKLTELIPAFTKICDADINSKRT
jgi:hypothetical protein